MIIYIPLYFSPNKLISFVIKAFWAIYYLFEPKKIIIKKKTKIILLKR